MISISSFIAHHSAFTIHHSNEPSLTVGLVTRRLRIHHFSLDDKPLLTRGLLHWSPP